MDRGKNHYAPTSASERPSSCRWFRPPSIRRKRTPSSTSGVEAMTMSDGFRMAYDAYHETTFTLAPIHGLLSGPASASEEPLARVGQQNFMLNSGNYKHRLQEETLSAVILDYQDFSPSLAGFDDSGNLRCLDTFSDLVTRANDWLRQNPQMVVRTCETITWSTSRVVKVGDTENMVQEGIASQSPKTTDDIYYFSGLRLWITPDKFSTKSAYYSASDIHKGQCLSYRDYKPVNRNSLSHLISQVNDDLMKHPLQGKVATVETVFLPEIPSADTSCLFWKQSANQRTRCNVFIRLFYITGSTSQLQTIGIRNIVPQYEDGAYESFNELLQRARLWVMNESHYTRVTNAKSYILPYNGGSFETEASRCIHESPEPGQSLIPQSSTQLAGTDQQYFLVLRVFYVQTSSTDNAIYDTDASCLHRLVASKCGRVRPMNIRCAVFSPLQTSAGIDIQTTFEKMKQTMLRISSWIQEAGIEVHSVESYTSPLLPSSQNHCLPDVTSWALKDITSSKGKKTKFLMHIRVYFESSSELQLQEPSVIIPPILCPPSKAVASEIEEQHRRRWKKERRWRARKLHLVFFCIFLFAVCIPAGGLFYLNALQTPD